MRYGTEMFFATLDQTLHHFPGRTATPVTVFGPQVTDWPATWARLYDTLGLAATPRPGDTTTNGDEVYFTNPHTLGLRTPTALHRYIRGFHSPLIAAHELFDGDPSPQPWSKLLHRLHTTKD